MASNPALLQKLLQEVEGLRCVFQRFASLGGPRAENRGKDEQNICIWSESPVL